MPSIKITPKSNGPYEVSGDEPVELRNVKGEVIPTDGAVYLCRCGHSGNKPLCDGSHSRVGFEDA